MVLIAVVNAKQVKWYGKKKKENESQRRKNIGVVVGKRRSAQRKFLLFFSFSFFFGLSLSGSLWILAAGDCETTEGPASLSVEAGAGADDTEVSRRRLPRIGMFEMEPARRVPTERRRASRWKFCDEIRLRFGSASGSGVPLRSGVPTSGANVMPGAWAVEGAFCDAASSDDVPVGNAIGAASDVGKAKGLGVASLPEASLVEGNAIRVSSTCVPAVVAGTSKTDPDSGVS